MRKTFILVTGILLCLVLSGCGRQDNTAGGDQPLSLQDMAVDTIERETFQDESAAETGTTADGNEADRKTAEKESLEKETLEKETSAANNNTVETTAGAAEGNEADKTQPDEPKTVDTPNRDFEEIKEYLSRFPNTLQELSETECYVILHGNEYSGREYLNTFIENMKAETSGELVFVEFTTEGAAILTYLNYDGDDVYCVEDITRDGFAGGNGEKYFEKYFDSIWLSANTDAEGNTSLSLCALWEEDIVQDMFTSLTEDPLWYGLPPWAKPPAP